MTKYSFQCKIDAVKDPTYTVAIRKLDLIQTCWKSNLFLDIY